MTLEKLKKMLVPGTQYVCTYGYGRIEEYNIDHNVMFGYDSSGNYKWLPLDNDEFDINLLRTISTVKELWKKSTIIKNKVVYNVK